MLKRKFHGHLYEVRFVKSIRSGRDGKKVYGDCSPPTVPNRRIRLLKNLSDRELGYNAIHEALHACGWWADESWVEETASDLAQFLLEDLGFRRHCPGCQCPEHEL